MMKAQEDVRSEWTPVCSLEDIVPDTGVCCLVGQKQVAIFRVRAGGQDERLFAIGNFDPFSRANVLSRGIVGDKKGRLMVFSPIYKQAFSLETGECLDDSSVRVPTFQTRVCNGIVEVQDSLTRPLRTGNTPLLSEVQTG